MAISAHFTAQIFMFSMQAKNDNLAHDIFISIGVDAKDSAVHADV